MGAGRAAIAAVSRLPTVERVCCVVVDVVLKFCCSSLEAQTVTGDLKKAASSSSLFGDNYRVRLF